MTNHYNYASKTLQATGTELGLLVLKQSNFISNNKKTDFIIYPFYCNVRNAALSKNKCFIDDFGIFNYQCIQYPHLHQVQAMEIHSVVVLQ